MTEKIREAFLKTTRKPPPGAAPEEEDEGPAGHFCSECGGELHAPAEAQDKEAPEEASALDEDTKAALFAKALKEKQT